MATRRWTFRVAAERRDELIAELWQLGTLGVHLRDDDEEELVDAYFAAPGPEPEAVGEACGARLLAASPVVDEDWLAHYRARSRPFRVGPFLLAPGEPEDALDLDEGDPAILLRVPARNAFGTGSHESTRLILESLPGLEVGGREVLDVGTGSGILALAALRLGARRAVGVDLDVGSVGAAARRCGCRRPGSRA
jgi:ribosomal protein L11 methyltransferase